MTEIISPLRDSNIDQRMVGQLTPSVTTAQIIYNPLSNMIFSTIKHIIICNLSLNNARAFSIFLDNNGTTFDDSTALFLENFIEPRKTIILTLEALINTNNANLAVKTNTADSITFTVFANEILQSTP